MITTDVRELLTAACAEKPRPRWLEYVDDLDVPRYISRHKVETLLRLTNGKRGRPLASVHFTSAHPKTGKSLLYPMLVIEWKWNPNVPGSKGRYWLEWRHTPWAGRPGRRAGEKHDHRRESDTSRRVTFTDRRES